MQETKPITADRIQTTPEFLVIYVGKAEHRIRWEDCSERLANAKPSERINATLSVGGYGIHWPLIDEDLSVQGLIRR